MARTDAFLQQSFMDYGSRRGPDPDIIVGMSFTLAIAVAFPLAIAYARRIWRGKPSTQAQADTVAPRLDRIEQAVEAIAIEVERVAEGQRFVTKVFAERPAQAQMNVAAESPLARDAAAGLGEAKPFLALGAGPIEPIRVQRTSDGAAVDYAPLRTVSTRQLATMRGEKGERQFPRMYAD